MYARAARRTLVQIQVTANCVALHDILAGARAEV